MRAGHFCLKVRLCRCHIAATAECERGDGLQTEERNFSDCKFYEDRWATIMDILSENGIKDYRKSVTEFLRLEEIYLYKATVTQ
jgi:hypothetical protein